MEGAQGLPFEAIGGEAIAVSLANRIAAELLAPIFRVALLARQIELTAAGDEIVAPGLIELPVGVINRNRNGNALRLLRHKSSEGKQGLAFIGVGGKTLMLCSALIDPAIEVQKLSGLAIDQRITRSNATHAISVTTRTGWNSGTVDRAKKILTSLDTQISRVLE